MSLRGCMRLAFEPITLPYSSKYIPVVVPEYLGNPTYDSDLDRSTAISRVDKTLTSFKACVDDRCTGLYWITVGSQPMGIQEKRIRV